MNWYDKIAYFYDFFTENIYTLYRKELMEKIGLKTMSDRLYLFIFLLIYLFFVFFLRSYLLWKRTGVNPLTFDKTDDAHGYNGKSQRVLWSV